MGACGSSMSEEDKQALKRSKEIEQKNLEAFKREQEKIKLLLLGAGESGKSTIFKQMKVLYGADLTDDERRTFTAVVYSNTISSMKILVEKAKEFGKDSLVEDKASFDKVDAADEGAVIDEDLGNAIKSMWADPGIQATWEIRSEFQIVESVKFYFGDIDRIMQPDFLATQNDMLYARVRTSGIVTERYEIDGSIFEMYDVGGQRNERKKWIHCFDDVTAVIFVAALSEYDQKLFEDADTNRMSEALELFDEICNNRYFSESSMILFLNKKDLFAEKIRIKDIKDTPAFADFPGGLGDYDLGIEFFLSKFLALNKNPDRTIYHHATCATDTGNVATVFNACKVRSHGRHGGF
mmetsp:Transcript_19673/g.59582  ORF Transcript_19673/g.59582 Transcript_19673/m.59582 type:complete len:352 (-) Transcript_19673:286-1341(-)